MPLFLVLTYKSLIKLPPQGSVILDTFKVGQTLISRAGWKAAWKGGDHFWNTAKPVGALHITLGNTELNIFTDANRGQWWLEEQEERVDEMG